MLVLTLQEGDYVMLGDEICVRYSKEMSSGYIKIGIDAPRSYKISRGAVFEQNLSEKLKEMNLNLNKAEERIAYTEKIKKAKSKVKTATVIGS